MNIKKERRRPQVRPAASAELGAPIRLWAGAPNIPRRKSRRCPAPNPQIQNAPEQPSALCAFARSACPPKNPGANDLQPVSACPC